MDADTVLAEKLAAILPHLNERQRRLLLAAEARALGRGGVTRVSQASGVSRPTITRAMRELQEPAGFPARVRRVGAGRKRLRERDPELVAELEALVEPDSRGDPTSPLRWTCKSTRQLADTLTRRGHTVSHMKVAQLLHEADYSLQANFKTLEGTQHPDRDAQFQYLNEQVKAFLAEGLPVISVDTKKKELVGTYKNGGREWRPKGQPEEVNVHDFPDPKVGVVQLIGATTNRQGLQVQAELDTGQYPTNVKVTDAELAAVRITPHSFHGEWNYTICPTTASSQS